MNKLKELLDAVNVTYSEMRFSSDGGVAELGSNMFVSSMHVYGSNEKGHSYQHCSLISSRMLGPGTDCHVGRTMIFCCADTASD